MRKKFFGGGFTSACDPIFPSTRVKRSASAAELKGPSGISDIAHTICKTRNKNTADNRRGNDSLNIKNISTPDAMYRKRTDGEEPRWKRAPNTDMNNNQKIIALAR